MTTTATERDARIEEYIEREARSELLHVLTENLFGVYLLDPDLGKALFPRGYGDSVQNELSGAIWSELWPADEEKDFERSYACPEAVRAQARAHLIAARVLQEAGAHPELLLEAASQLTTAALGVLRSDRP